MAQSMIIYSDGGCKNQTSGGWGIHGYLYENVPPKKSIVINSEHIYTGDGYKLKDKEGNGAEVTPIHHIDGYGSMMNSTNNAAELLAAIRGMEHASKYVIEKLTVFTDSEYVRKGLEFWLSEWKKNNWTKRDGTEPANIELWKKLDELRNSLFTKGIAVEVRWVKGHSDKISEIDDELGNIVADKLATIGTHAAASNMNLNVMDTFTAADIGGYWKHKVEKNPLLNHRSMFFTTMPGFNTPGEYYIGNQSTDIELFGKKISDGAFAIVRLKEPDPTIELMRNHQVKLAADKQTIIFARIDQLFKQNINRDISIFGELALIRRNPIKLDLVSLDKAPITEELDPPKLAMRAVEAMTILGDRLDMYSRGDENLTVTDITDLFYEQEVKKSGKDKEVVVNKLKSEYVVGFPAVKPSIKYNVTGTVEEIPVTLTLGIDMPDRNSLKNIESNNPKVKVVTWKLSDTVFSFATIVETDIGMGIWCGIYSNTIYLNEASKKKEKK